MKKVQRADLATATETRSFAVAAKEVKAEATKIVRTSYSLEQRHVDQINTAALTLSQRKGKTVGASEALRHILDLAKEITP